MKFFKTKLAVALLASGLSFSAAAADITVAYDSDPVTLDPHEQLSGGVLQMSHMLFDPLVRFTKEFDFEPRLAEKWERIDDNTFRFTLRKGVTFHSGNKLTADDVVWTFNRLKSSGDFKAVFSPYEKMVKIDDYTIEIISFKPYPLVLQTATYIFPMDSKFYSGEIAGVDKSVIVKHGNSFASTHASGTGPFTITSREQGVKVVFERFDNYWDKKSPGNVDKLTLVPIRENATRIAALLSGGVDLIHPVAPNDQQRVTDSKNLELTTVPGTRIITFQMNQHSNPALRDVRVRQAIVYAINNDGIVKRIMKGFATTAGQQGPEGYAGYDASLVPRYDLEKAKKLMKEAGYEKGFKLTMMAPNNRYVNDAQIAQATTSMLARIGITVDLKTLPKAQYWPEFDKCSADMMMIGWHSDTEDSANLSEFLTMTRDAETGKGAYNCGYYSNPKVDELVNKSNSETDPAKRAAMLQEVERILYNDAAFVPLHWQNLAWGAKSNLDVAPIVNALNFPYFGDLVVK
ncbi:ABC transporter substrate-binding protein [Psychromonas sp. RZ22]|uniref:ABC transporter substrate-binding protein n=1 Tax=Psychromonas algarum TaxID=2555643 RepID=UPI00106824B6|nr:ABC transporter substrate-binding protein [Psychromonas sp. RZ22]TEW54631.1 ABC transporter substrate-binding protein [Psychromonas sp. RZ22]